jgi:outer membrane protein assembly factor BamB
MNDTRIELALRTGPEGEPAYVPLGSFGPRSLAPTTRPFGARFRSAAGLAVTAAVAIALVVAVVVIRQIPSHVAGPPSAAVDYPLYKGNIGHTGEGAGPAPGARPTNLWTVGTGSEVWSSAAVVGDDLYIVGGDGNLRRLDATTGAERWRTSGATYVGSPSVSGALVFVLDTDGALASLVAVNASDGTVAWRQDTRSSIQVWPLPIGDLVVAGGPDRTLRAFDAATGAARWATSVAGGDILRSPSSADGLIVYGSTDGVVHAVDATDGREHWHVSTEALAFGTPAMRDGAVYVGAQRADGTYDLLALAADDGHELWRFSPDVRTELAPPSVDGDTVYVQGADGDDYAIWRDTGALRWIRAGTPTTLFTIALVGDSALTFDGSELLALDRTNGKERWRTDVGAGPNSFISAAGGRLFIGLPSGDVVALGSPEVAPGSPSP